MDKAKFMSVVIYDNRCLFSWVWCTIAMLSSHSTLAQDRSSPVPPANMSRNQGTTLFMFGDSSGDSSRSAKSLNMSPYYIICTVILDSVELIRINSLMIKLKKMHFAGRNPLFVESESGNVVQLADMIAFIVARHYRSGNDPQFERWYTQLNSKFGSVVKFMSG